MTAQIMVGMVVIAPKLIARYGPKAMVVTGMATLAAGMVTLSLIHRVCGPLRAGRVPPEPGEITGATAHRVRTPLVAFSTRRRTDDASGLTGVDSGRTAPRQWRPRT